MGKYTWQRWTFPRKQKNNPFTRSYFAHPDDAPRLCDHRYKVVPHS